MPMRIAWLAARCTLPVSRRQRARWRPGDRLDERERLGRPTKVGPVPGLRLQICTASDKYFLTVKAQKPPAYPESVGTDGGRSRSRRGTSSPTRPIGTRIPRWGTRPASWQRLFQRRPGDLCCGGGQSTPAQWKPIGSCPCGSAQGQRGRIGVQTRSPCRRRQRGTGCRRSRCRERPCYKTNVSDARQPLGTRTGGTQRPDQAQSNCQPPWSC